MVSVEGEAYLGKRALDGWWFGAVRIDRIRVGFRIVMKNHRMMNTSYKYPISENSHSFNLCPMISLF